MVYPGTSLRRDVGHIASQRNNRTSPEEFRVLYNFSCLENNESFEVIIKCRIRLQLRIENKTRTGSRKRSKNGSNEMVLEGYQKPVAILKPWSLVDKN